MKLKHFCVFIVIFAICFSFCNVMVFTYPTTTKKTSSSAYNYDLGKRYLKLGNTYREAKEFEKALEYLQKGQSFFRNQTSFEEQYWYAVSLEYLGYYYRDTKHFNRASSLLTEARMLFANIITQEAGSDVAVNAIYTKLINNNRNEKTNLDNSHFKNVAAGGHPHQRFNHLWQNNQLIVLNLNNRNLIDFPGDFTDNKVDHLSMCGNQLQRVPERINYFVTLQVLELSNNKITQFPFLNNLKKLQTLDLSQNNLNEIGAGIGELTSLEYLNLSNNPITYISNAIFRLKNLKVLNVRNTKLTRYFIDDLFSKLPNAIILYDAVSEQQNETNFNEEEDFGWGTDDDEFNLEWEDW